MDAPAQYLEELRSELSLYPTWLPGEPIELGTFGTLKRGAFVVDGRLQDLDIAFVPNEHGGKLDVKTSRGIKFHAAATRSATAGSLDAAAGIELEVERANAWAFAARGVCKTDIGNIEEVQRAVLEARKAGMWKRRWLLVTEVRHVDRLTVLVARSKRTKGRARAEGTLAEPRDILLQDNASFEFSTDDVFQVRNAKHATPLYGLRKLTGFLDPHLGAFRAANTDGPAEPRLALEIADDEPFFSDDTP